MKEAVMKIMIISVLLAVSLQCSNRPRAPYPWQWAADMPFGRHDHDAVYAPDGRIYVMGGQIYRVHPRFSVSPRSGDWFIDSPRTGDYSNVRFDPKLNKWELMRSIPGTSTGPDYCGHDPLNDIWYRFRYKGNFVDSDDFWYWRERVPEAQMNKKKIAREDIFKLKLRIYDCNFERQGYDVALATVPRGIIYWTGGESFSGPMESLALPYNIADDSWPSRYHKKQPGNITTHQTGLLSKNFYLMDQREYLATDMPPMQERRTAHRAVGLADGRIVVMGGWHNGLQPPLQLTPEDKKRIVPQECFDPKTGTWRMMMPEPVSRGTTREEFLLDSVECYEPKANAWRFMKPMPAMRLYFSAVLARDGKIYVFGGRDAVYPERGMPFYATTWAFDPDQNTWEERRPMPEPREGFSGALGADGRIWLSGGDAYAGGPASPKVFVYDPERDAWEEGPEMMLPRAGHAMAATPDGRLYAIGGSDVEAYRRDPALKEHIRPFMTPRDWETYKGKVQEMVEVLDVLKWRRSKGD